MATPIGFEPMAYGLEGYTRVKDLIDVKRLKTFITALTTT